MNRVKPAVCICALLLSTSATAKPQETKEKQETHAPTPRSKDGKKLFGTAEALRVARVFSPRISPDGLRVAYLAAENKMDKDKPWKSVTPPWLVPTSGPVPVNPPGPCSKARPPAAYGTGFPSLLFLASSAKRIAQDARKSAHASSGTRPDSLDTHTLFRAPLTSFFFGVCWESKLIQPKGRNS